MDYQALSNAATNVIVAIETNPLGSVSTDALESIKNQMIFIRGRGTTNNTNPLVIIDGVEGDMNALNPNDIEAISVLKDAASAAIYG